MRKLLQSVLFVTAAAAAGSALASATFFEGEGFSGQPLRVDGVLSDFRAYDFNDRAMSMIVEGAPMEVCVDINFGGGCQVFSPGQYQYLGSWAATISSVRPAYYGRNGSRRDYYGYDRDRGYEPSARWHYDPRYERRGY